MVKQYTVDNVTIAAGAMQKVSISAPAISGYTRTIISTSLYNATSGGVATSACSYNQETINGNNIEIAVKNNHTSYAKIRIIVYVLYLKS